jgi:hypothetical protein
MAIVRSLLGYNHATSLSLKRVNVVTTRVEPLRQSGRPMGAALCMQVLQEEAEAGVMAGASRKHLAFLANQVRKKIQI